MPKKDKQPVETVEHMDQEHERPDTAYTSRFKEGTMDSRASIHPPPDELWKDLNIEHMIERFNEEAGAPAPTFSAAIPTISAVTQKRPAAASRAASGSSYNTSTDVTTESAPEGTFSRLSRALTSWFNGAGASFSSLGKRKAGSEMAEHSPADKALHDRKKEVEEAYRLAKEQGLLPTPKVFVRPASRAKPINGKSSFLRIDGNNQSNLSLGSLASSVPATPTPNGLTLATTPRTPALYKTPSKRDLHKQKKLSKRVSNLEHKLQEARKELSIVLGPHNPNPVPPLPTLPTNLPPTPTTNPSFSASEASPQSATEVKSATPTTDAKIGKIVKKRKAIREGDTDGEYKPIPTDTDTDTDYSHARASESDAPSTKRTKITPPKKSIRKKSTRLTKKKTNTTQRVEKEQVVTVVPDGVAVPPIPNIPTGVRGKRVQVSDDGYGGFEHEMF
ncbi:uncharacterized protein N0V89_009986 [Didymosphaeria variabile]|uniref:Uncharacterized protein n=1 Tax=Didymosphaeria variabile TaxID=1932322 RepID=A0A9W8XGN2_9PLEO|nr:uncharacterized protein N0V89_009986 [Didymosphaeria variabile]KAJ4348608.1 hypothetical protein N0V89_009986 [Didymosphaeria variabile]